MTYEVENERRRRNLAPLAWNITLTRRASQKVR